MKSVTKLWRQAVELLEAEGIAPDPEAWKRLCRHVELIAEWNARVSLVSSGDLEHLWERHVVDSLSLAPLIVRHAGLWLDIGSGGGFPALPVASVLPDVEVVLLERSERKLGFLRKAVAALSLDRVRIVLGEFPRCAGDLEPRVITARAVERPWGIARHLSAYLPSEAVFMAQFPKVAEAFGSKFHVEPVEDAWSQTGLRRGRLHLVRRVAP